MTPDDDYTSGFDTNFWPMDEQRQDDQLEPVYHSSVPIQDVALKTYRERWMIERGGGRGSGRSVLVARHDDDKEDEESIERIFL